VEQRPPVDAAAADKAPKMRSEADLRGRLNNDSLTADEKKQLEDERKAQEEAAKKRDQDFQMAFALDLLRGMSVIKAEK